MKDIPGFEGLYAVTEDGNIWAYPRTRTVTSALGKAFNVHHKGKWRKSRIDIDGYADITLVGNGGNRVIRKVHRFVALAYIPNPNGLKEINHKNGNKLDNRIENLEWCTRKENAAHAKSSGFYAAREVERKNKRKRA